MAAAAAEPAGNPYCHEYGYYHYGPRLEQDSDPLQLAMRRSCSMPALASSRPGFSEASFYCGEASCTDAVDSGLEVYVFCRPFHDFGGGTFQKLPPGVKDGLSKLGVCHFLTAFATPDGRIHVFDFGPRGGDVHVGLPGRRQQSASCAPLAQTVPWYRMGWTMFSRDPSGTEAEPTLPPAGTEGEVREKILPALPENRMYVGRTSLTLRDIREYNQLQNSIYDLNNNDCRHYVNNLVRYTTGLHGASTALTDFNFRTLKNNNLRWDDHLFRAAQTLTDVNNWPTVKSVGQATVAAAGVFMARLGLRPVFQAHPVPYLSTLPAKLTSKWIAKPVGNAAMAAVATASASRRDPSTHVRNPLFKGFQFNERMHTVVNFFGSVGHGVGTTAARRLSRTASATAAVVTSAGTATRSAATVATRALGFRPRLTASSSAQPSARAVMGRPSAFRPLRAGTPPSSGALQQARDS